MPLWGIGRLTKVNLYVQRLNNINSILSVKAEFPFFFIMTHDHRHLKKDRKIFYKGRNISCYDKITEINLNVVVVNKSLTPNITLIMTRTICPILPHVPISPMSFFLSQ